MFRLILLALALILQHVAISQKTIHVFVALCDNVHQGIVPVPSSLGNGQDPKSNLYWGAAYGVKSFFGNKAPEWKRLECASSSCEAVLDRALYYNAAQDAYLLAEAYDGAYIKTCIEDFVLASNHQNALELDVNQVSLAFGGSADLVAYCGHNGLMEFDLDISLNPAEAESKPAIVLACFSQSYFASYFKQSNATPLLCTTHLMAPEAYTLRAAVNAWLAGNDGVAIKESAAQAYNSYQKCGINGARRLFSTGF